MGTVVELFGWSLRACSMPVGPVSTWPDAPADDHPALTTELREGLIHRVVEPGGRTGHASRISSGLYFSTVSARLSVTALKQERVIIVSTCIPPTRLVGQPAPGCSVELIVVRRRPTLGLS